MVRRNRRLSPSLRRDLLIGDDMPNRYICDVLKEMRTCYETRNFSYFLGLTEEIQHLASKMEAKLHDYKDSKYDEKYIKDLKKEKNELNDEIGELEEKIEELKKELKCLENTKE